MAGTPLKGKLIVSGDQNVGKSSILNRFIKDDFHSEYHPTRGVELLAKSLTIKCPKVKDDVKLDLDLFDISGNPIFATMSKIMAKHADAAMLIYAIDDYGSFESIKRRVEEVKKNYDDEIDLI